MSGTRIAMGVLAAAGMGFGTASIVRAQAPVAQPSAAPSTQVIVSVSPEKATLLKMSRRTSLKVEETRLEDVIKFLQDVTQADIEPIWQGDTSGAGLDKDKKITLKIDNQPALYVLEAVLEKARGDFAGSENAWQMSSSGAIQVGPKEALNKTKRVVIYDINDLLMIIPRYTDVPQIDLNSVLQSNMGGGGQSPFQNGNTQNNPLDNQMVRDDRAKKIMDLITSLVEQPQWTDNGGEGASMHLFNGTLIVNAPDYIHRQINGYPYWPSTTTRVASKGGHRYVTLNMDTGISKVKGIRNVPVTATVGGGGGTGGGGNGPPGP